jgi:hypothetical protein
MESLQLLKINNGRMPEPKEYCDRTIYQTSEWLNFIAHTQNAEPVVADVRCGGITVGRFSGLIIRKFGVRILGSPFPGWTTAYMGFNLDPSFARAEALQALERFAFDEMGCAHLEIMDRRMTMKDYDDAGFSYRRFSGFEVDLTQSEEKLYAAMESGCRWSIRKSVREGVRIEESTDLSFADEYYAQLIDVFAKQKLVPTYSKDRVVQMLKYMMPTGHVLLLKAKDKSDRCIATGIFLALNDTIYFWGGASWREYQHLRPNEALHWYAMRYGKARNFAKYDMEGAGEYKRKYGGYPISVPWGRKSKYPFIEGLRRFGMKVYKARQHVSGFLNDVNK